MPETVAERGSYSSGIIHILMTRIIGGEDRPRPLYNFLHPAADRPRLPEFHAPRPEATPNNLNGNGVFTNPEAGSRLLTANRQEANKLDNDDNL